MFNKNNSFFTLNIIICENFQVFNSTPSWTWPKHILHYCYYNINNNNINNYNNINNNIINNNYNINNNINNNNNNNINNNNNNINNSNSNNNKNNNNNNNNSNYYYNCYNNNNIFIIIILIIIVIVIVIITIIIIVTWQKSYFSLMAIGSLKLLRGLGFKSSLMHFSQNLIKMINGR